MKLDNVIYHCTTTFRAEGRVRTSTYRETICNCAHDSRGFDVTLGN